MLPRILAVVAGAVFTLLMAPVSAQKYPAKPVRLIVPFPPGQSADIHARLIAEHLSKSLGQQVVVDNRGGASGIIGVEAAARAVPDGYTLVMATSGPFGINPALHSKLPYDVIRDFAPIINLAYVPQTLVTASTSPVKSAEELVVLVKAKPGNFNFGSSGSGTTNHLTMEMLRSRLGLDIVHVSYKGSAPALIDVMSGKMLVMFDALPSVLSHVKSERLRALAISTTRRSPLAPEVPTVAETIAPGFEASGWAGMAAPARTPEPIIRLLRTEIMKLLSIPEVKERYSSLGLTVIGSTPEEFAAFLKTEVAKWTKVVRDSGAKVE